MFRKGVVLVLALVLAFPTVAFAEGTTLTNPGISPDSPLYALDRLFESVQLALTFDEQAKADLLTQIAEERLAESVAMLEKGKTDLGENALAEYKDTIEEVVDKAEEFLVEGLDAASVMEKINEVQDKLTEARTAILEDVAEANKEAVENDLNELMEKTESTQEFVDITMEKEQDTAENETPSLKQTVTTQILNDTIKDPTFVEKVQTEGLGLREITVLKVLAEKSGKTLDEVYAVYTAQDKDFGETVKALDLNQKEMLSAVKATFTATKDQVKTMFIKAREEQKAATIEKTDETAEDKDANEPEEVQQSKVTAAVEQEDEDANEPEEVQQSKETAVVEKKDEDANKLEEVQETKEPVTAEKEDAAEQVQKEQDADKDEQKNEVRNPQPASSLEVQAPVNEAKIELKASNEDENKDKDQVPQKERSKNLQRSHNHEEDSGNED